MPILPRAITPLGSIATRAGRRDVGQSLSNVVFQGTVLRVREVPGDVATRYSYDVRVQIGRSDATRVTIAGARASESQPRGLQAVHTPSSTRATRCRCYRVSRSEWIIVGRERGRIRRMPEASLAFESGRTPRWTMHGAGYVLAGSAEARAASSRRQRLRRTWSWSVGCFPSAGVHAAMLRLVRVRRGGGAHNRRESGRLSWSDGVLALASSGPNHERDRVTIPVLIEDSDAKRQKYRYYAVGRRPPCRKGSPLDAAPDPGMRGKTAGADPR